MDDVQSPEPTFDEPAAQAFLAEPHVGVLAVAGPGGPPAAVPLWYVYANNEVWILTPPGSRKAPLLEAEQQATLVVDTVTPRTRFVSVDLELTGSREATDADVRELASRYLTGDALETYLLFAAAHLQERRYTFRPTRWRFADMTG